MSELSEPPPSSARQMMDSQFLHKQSKTPSTGVGASAGSLPADILADASKRLGWAGLIYSTTFFLAFFGAHFFGSGGPEGHSLMDMWLQTVVSIISIVLGLIVFALSRFCHSPTAWIRPELLLDLGLIFQVVGAFGIAMSTFWGFCPDWSRACFENFHGVPWESVWILIFPLVAPNTPGKVLLASLAAASTGLLTFMLSQSFGATDPLLPLQEVFVYYLFTTYLCAGIAFVMSRIVYKYGRTLKKAREVGSYRLAGRLGVGGMGEVWMAKHRMLARPAAIKLIRPEAFGSDADAGGTMIRRFEREAQATAALRSCHTIELYDFGITDEGAFYYVMEMLNGLTLDSLVKRFGPVPSARTIYLMRQVCHSLGEAHLSGLVHRDIKPANIYSCRLGPDYDFVKVLDFGLVKAAGSTTSGATELTAEGIATGTPAFMPPEMALGKTDVDGRADLYALGCVGYWLLTGSRVFEEDNPLATVVAHVQEKPVPPSQRTELDIPDSLERVILHCLEKDPADRPQSADELDSLLAECQVDGVWGTAEAKDWWMLHVPEVELPPADVASEEIAPQETLAVDDW